MFVCSSLFCNIYVHLIHSLINYRGIPFAVIIHCGGNDIGLIPGGELLFHIKFTIAILSSMLPGTSLVWSSILPRMKWRYSENMRNMEITRKRVNRVVRSYLLKIGGYVITYPNFDDKHPLCLKRTVCICRLLPMTFFSTKYKVLSKHFWNTLIVWFIFLTEISKCWNEGFVLLLPLLKMFTPFQGANLEYR
jgi:hypothetical protein